MICLKPEEDYPFKPAVGGYLGGEMAHDGGDLLWGRCVITGDMYPVEVRELDLEMYEGGVLAQNAFPDLTPEDREFIISGISPKGWAKMHKDEDGNE